MVTLEESEDVYDRQSRIENWDQGKIRNSKILIAGEDLLGEMVLGCLLGLGIENIFILDNNSKDRTSFLSKEKTLEQTIDTAVRINPKARIKGFKSGFSREILEYENFSPNFIIDTTNRVSSKELALEYAIEKGIGFISAYCSRKKSAVSVYSQKRENIEEILDSEKILNGDNMQGIVTSGISAGIIADEIRKSLFKVNNYEENLRSRIIYNLESSTRTSIDSNRELKTKDVYKKKVLVAGAGAIGNFAALSLALSGFGEIDILDFDTIDQTNMNRQILFYERLGKGKANVLSERIREIREIKSMPINRLLDENSEELFKDKKYDLIFGCFDNLEARYYLNEFAVKFGIPYLDGGTAAFRGSIYSYAPKKTPCIKCKKSLEPIKAKRSCARTLPSVIIPNMVIGSAMSGEAVNILSGNIENKSFVYDSSCDSRIYMEDDPGKREGCSCMN